MTAASADGSLRGRSIAVTRPEQQAGGLNEALRSRGATVLPAPAIELVPAPVEPLDRAVTDLAEGSFDWVLFTSRRAVEAVADRLEAADRDATWIGARIGAVGDGTAEELRARGVEPHLIPPTFTTEALVDAMPKGSGRVLLPRADIAPGHLEEELRAKGWTPVRVDAYHTRLATTLPPETWEALSRGAVDAVTFTSASTVRGFAGVAAGVLQASPAMPLLVAIGPVTADAVRSQGWPVAIVASPHTIGGLVEALEQALGPAGPNPEESGP